VNRIAYYAFGASTKGSETKKNTLASGRLRTKMVQMMVERACLSESNDSTITPAKKNMYTYPAIP